MVKFEAKETTTEELSKKQKENIKELAMILTDSLDSFEWRQTSSGQDYWLEVRDKLRSLYQQESKKCSECGRKLDD